MAILPEEPSAFSWEDVYSNLLGIRIGAQVMQDQEHGYDEAMTIALRNELENLGVQSSTTARKASEKMRGIWYDGILLVDMKERNLDIGLDDGFVTPMLVPGICEGVEAQSYPVPTLEKFDRYGFRMRLEVEPREFERGKVLKIVYPNGGHKRIQPTKHIGEIVEYIRNVIKSRGWKAEGGEQITDNGGQKTAYRTKGIRAAGNQRIRISGYQEIREKGKTGQRINNAENGTIAAKSLSVTPDGENHVSDVGIVDIGVMDGVEAGDSIFK
jgi:hypothetical protein